MKRLKLMLKILKITNVDKLIYTYLIYIAIMSAILLKVEPNVRTYFDGIWYCAVTASTVGFGDIVVSSTIGKILSIILMIFSMLIIAIITGTLVDFYQEIQRLKYKDTITTFLNKLENLPDLSKEELVEISDNIKGKRYKI